MTIEAILLLGIFVFLLLGAFIGPNGPRSTFAKAGPRLAARIESNLSTGRGFKDYHDGAPHAFDVPPSGAPDGEFQ